VIGAVVSAPGREVAKTAGEVAISSRETDQLTDADDTQVTQISEFEGEPPFPIGRGYESLPGVVEANSETGQQLLADLVKHVRFDDNRRPQIYDEYGDPLDGWETEENLQTRFDAEDTWIVTAVVRQLVDKEDKSTDRPTMEKLCSGICARTKHVFTGSTPKAGEEPDVWKCTRCGSTQPGHAQEADLAAAFEPYEDDEE
jgi:hypothetical protein